MEESIYRNLLKYVDEKQTTFDFYLGSSGPVIYYEGKRIEKNVPDVKENNDLEEIMEDINRMPVSFAVRNAEAVFKRGGIHTEEHEEEIESWKDLDQKALPVFVEEILKTTDDLQLLAFALLAGSHIEKPSRQLLKMYELFSALQDTNYYAMPLLRKQPDANELLFEALKMSSGSALVELLEEVKPDTEEKVRWMLRYGRDPVLDWWQTAACVAEKCRISELLKKEDLPQEELTDIAWIIANYFAEGPAHQLYTRVPDWYEQMEDVLVLFRKRPDGMVPSIARMQDCLEMESDRDERLPGFLEKCRNALKDPDVISHFEKKVQESHDGYEDALILGIDCRKEIREDLCSSFPQSIGYAGVFKDDENMLAYILKKIIADPDFRKIQSRNDLYRYFRNPFGNTIPVLLQEASRNMEECLPFFEVIISYGGAMDASKASVLVRNAAKTGQQIPPEILKKTKKWENMISFAEKMNSLQSNGSLN